MIDVKYTEPKSVCKKKVINVKNVAIQDNCLVDIETGETDILDKIATEIPDGISTLNFKLTFELLDEDGE